MGKKVMKGYKIFILFLLMSVSAFTEETKEIEQWIYSQVAREKLETTDSGFFGIGSKYYNISFYKGLKKLKSVEVGNKNLKDFLSSDGSYKEETFKPKPEEEEVYLYNGKKNPMVEFKLIKNTGNPYNGTFKFIKNHLFWNEDKISQTYSIPAPTTDFSVDGDVFSYEDEKTKGKSIYKSQEVVFRLYTGERYNEIRPIKKLKKDDNLDNIYDSDNYVDFVFEKNKSSKTIELEGGITGIFKEVKTKVRKNEKTRWEFKLEGLNEGESYKLDFYTLRSGENRNKEYVVATYEDTIDFTGENSTNTESGEQYVYSQITKESLGRSEKYTINFKGKLIEGRATKTEGISLENYLSFSENYNETKFIKNNDKYKYSGTKKSMVKFELTKNEGESYEGKFKSDDKKYKHDKDKHDKKYKIDQYYKIPAPTSGYEGTITESSYRFIYTEDDSNNENGTGKYESEEAVFRLYTGDKKEGIRPLNKGDSLNSIYDSNNYVDFVFENDGNEHEIIIDGVTATFIEGKFKLEGLKKDRSYKVDFYTLRYGKNDKDKDEDKGKDKQSGNHKYVVVTHENTFEFVTNLPKIKKVTLVNNTLKSFLESIYNINKGLEGSEFEEFYSKYKDKSPEEISLEEILNYFSGKTGDEIELILKVEGKDIKKEEIEDGITMDGVNIESFEVSDPGKTADGLTTFDITLKVQIVESDIDVLKVINKIKKDKGYMTSQEIDVLSVDNIGIDITPGVKVGDIDIKPIDSIYYVNSEYNIDLRTTNSDDIRAGIVIFNYNNQISDKKNGNFENYNRAGGEKGDSILVKIKKNGDTDGEYITQVYGMSKSGKLKGIKDNLENLNKIVSARKDEGKIKEIVIRVDTVNPEIMDVSIKKSTEILDPDLENYYYFDISFDIEDFNASYEKIVEGSNIGHLLEGENIEIVNVKVENKTVTYKIKVNKPEKGKTITTVKINAVDKAGNPAIEKSIEIKIPKDIGVKVYEQEFEEWGEGSEVKVTDPSTDIEYVFTKGGSTSDIGNPHIYVSVIGDSGADVRYLIIKKNSKPKELLDILDKTEEIEIGGFAINSANILEVIPVGEYGVEGEPKIFGFVVDTRINSSYLEGGIIGEINNGKIAIDLTSLVELSGIDGYNYTLKVGTEERPNSDTGINKKSSITLDKNSSNEVVTIDISGLKEGSKGTLSFTVYDKLGNKRTYEKTYFIPTKPNGITATISGETKRRRSRVTILAEGSDEKFEIRRNSDESSDDD